MKSITSFIFVLFVFVVLIQPVAFGQSQGAGDTIYTSDYQSDHLQVAGFLDKIKEMGGKAMEAWRNMMQKAPAPVRDFIEKRAPAPVREALEGGRGGTGSGGGCSTFAGCLSSEERDNNTLLAHMDSQCACEDGEGSYYENKELCDEAFKITETSNTCKGEGEEDDQDQDDGDGEEGDDQGEAGDDQVGEGEPAEDQGDDAQDTEDDQEGDEDSQDQDDEDDAQDEDDDGDDQDQDGDDDVGEGDDEAGW